MWRGVGAGMGERLDSQVANGVDQVAMAMWQPEVFEAIARVVLPWAK